MSENNNSATSNTSSEGKIDVTPNTSSAGNNDVTPNTSSEGKIDVTPNTRSIYRNTEQDVIIITKDKLKLELLESADLFSSKKSWLTPFSLLITIIVTLITADFKNKLISSDTWTAFFLFVALACFIWMCKEIITLVKNWNKGDIDCFIQNLTKEENKNKNKK